MTDQNATMPGSSNRSDAEMKLIRAALQQVDAPAETVAPPVESSSIDLDITAASKPRQATDSVVMLTTGMDETIASPKPARNAPSVSASSDADRIGADALPGYVILRKLAGGGQGVVYEATQQSTRRRVAVKVVRGGVLAHPEHRARIERGIRILGQLNHPNIVGVIDSGVIDGALYYVMEYVSGKPLDDYIALQRSTSFEMTPSSDGAAGRLSKGPTRRAAVDSSRAQRQLIRKQLTLFAKICDGIDAAHVRGVIHRDLKPANVLIDDRAEPHVLDFDLAKILDGDLMEEDDSPKTQTGEFLGSLRWASPEQVERKPGAIDLRTDVYSLGVMLYEILVGQYPYPVIGTRREIEENILYCEPTRPRTIRRLIDDELETILLKCLAKEPSRRYRSAGELGFDIRSYLNGEPISAKRDSFWYIVRKRARQHYGVTAVVLSFLAILASFGFISFSFYLREVDARKRADVAAKQALVDKNEAGVLAESYATRLRHDRFVRFLLELDHGRIDEARRLAGSYQLPDAMFKPAHVATLFLLNPSTDPAWLRKNIPPEASDWFHLTMGEYHRRRGNLNQAIDEYEQVEKKTTGPATELVRFAVTRIQELRLKPSERPAPLLP